MGPSTVSTRPGNQSRAVSAICALPTPHALAHLKPMRSGLAHAKLPRSGAGACWAVRARRCGMCHTRSEMQQQDRTGQDRTGQDRTGQRACARPRRARLRAGCRESEAGAHLLAVGGDEERERVVEALEGLKQRQEVRQLIHLLRLLLLLLRAPRVRARAPRVRPAVALHASLETDGVVRGHDLENGRREREHAGRGAKERRVELRKPNVELPAREQRGVARVELEVREKLHVRADREVPLWVGRAEVHGCERRHAGSYPVQVQVERVLAPHRPRIRLCRDQPLGDAVCHALHVSSPL
eukprot:1849669-Rhodomonas_salina.4